MSRSEPPLCLLVTGFEPFGGSPVNPSREVLAMLAREWPAGAAKEIDTRSARGAFVTRVHLETAILPVVGGMGPGSAAGALLAAVERCRPDALLCLGETGSRDSICVEAVAVNQRHYRIPDNAGALVENEPVIAGAPSELAASLPVTRLVTALQSAGLRAEASTNAGRFLCNEIMFHAISLAAERRMRGAGFVHVPRLPEQISRVTRQQAGQQPAAPPLQGMTREECLRGVEVLIRELAAEWC
ncbi:MAG: hypothetical protein KF724_00290 [Phycisphaeraceae bacterium]|nr:hypothetical protein [Phycisphaeraceae bacterium]